MLLDGQVGRLVEARSAFEAAGQPLTSDQLIACGTKCLEIGWLVEAQRAFEAAAWLERQTVQYQGSWASWGVPLNTQPFFLSGAEQLEYRIRLRFSTHFVVALK
jgi:hypothetical protein